jgi:hypothetical protein
MDELNKGEWGGKGGKGKKAQLAQSKYDILQKQSSYLLQISNFKSNQLWFQN